MPKTVDYKDGIKMVTFTERGKKHKKYGAAHIEIHEDKIVKEWWKKGEFTCREVTEL